MRYLMLVCVDPSLEVGPGQGEKLEGWLAAANDARLLGSQVRPQTEAKVIRVRGGKPFVTDGPFAETKELIAGFDILECDSLEQAVAIASKHPVAEFGAIEVRAFWSMDEES